MKQVKTNAARLLDRTGVPYRLATYPVDEKDLSAQHLARTLDLDVNQVFKTLVVKGDKTGYLVCVIPGGRELALKKAAKHSGNKHCAMIPVKDLQQVTGYVRGGCSPLAMKKKFPTFIDSSASGYGEIYVSAGVRGVQLVVAPDGLLGAAEAVYADLCDDLCE